jgi:hypothetical protein
VKTTNHCACGAHYAALLLPFFLVAVLISSVASVSSAAPISVDLNDVAEDYHHINNTSGWLGHWVPIISDVNTQGTQTHSEMFQIEHDSGRGVDEVCSTTPVSAFKISPFKTTGDFDFWADFRVPTSSTINDNAIGLAWNIQDPDPGDSQYFGFNSGAFYRDDNLHRFTWDGLFHSNFEGYGDVIEGTSGVANYPDHDKYPGLVYGKRIIVEHNGINDFVYQDEPAPGDDNVTHEMGWSYDAANEPHKYRMSVSRRGDDFTFTLEELGTSGNTLLLEETYTEAGALDGRVGFFFARQEQVKISNIGYDLNPVPEPSSLLLALLGVIGLTCTGRGRRRRG